MQIRKGDRLTIKCPRKGTYDAVATEDFDTEADEWYEVAVDQDEPVRGMTQVWSRGSHIPCRRGQATITRR